MCTFDGFLLWVRIAYACPTIASLCNKLRQCATLDQIANTAAPMRQSLRKLQPGPVTKNCRVHKVEERSQKRPLTEQRGLQYPQCACTHKTPTVNRNPASPETTNSCPAEQATTCCSGSNRATQPRLKAALSTKSSRQATASEAEHTVPEPHPRRPSNQEGQSIHRMLCKEVHNVNSISWDLDPPY